MLPLIEQRDLQLHEVVPLLKHQGMQVLELALHLPVLELMALLQLHEQQVVIELVQAMQLAQQQLVLLA
jgi:hypothetical protein